MIPVLEIQQTDITKLKVDVIVNAANKLLLGGGGVDGAIHAAAGSKLREECETLNGCEFGQAKITKGCDLPAKYVIHAVGPIWGKHSPDEAEQLLHDCYMNCLMLAEEYKLESIAFPAISTGAYRYPKNEAAAVANQSLVEYFASKHDSSIKQIVMVLFSEKDKALYDLVFGDTFR